MDEIDALIKELKNDGGIWNTRFTRTLINEAGTIYETYGYGAAKMFLVDKKRDKRRQQEVKILLNVLSKIDRLNYPRNIGGYIIRKIDSLSREW